MTDDEFDSSREDETGASGEDPRARMDRVFEELYSNAEHPSGAAGLAATGGGCLVYLLIMGGLVMLGAWLASLT